MALRAQLNSCAWRAQALRRLCITDAGAGGLRSFGILSLAQWAGGCRLLALTEKHWNESSRQRVVEHGTQGAPTLQGAGAWETVGNDAQAVVGHEKTYQAVAMHENTFDGENDSRSIALGHYHDPRRPLDAPAGVMLGDERVQKGVLLLLMEIH